MSVTHNFPFNFSPRDYQVPVLKARDRGCNRIVMRWPRRAGKDVISMCILFREMIEKPGMYWYVFPEATQARKAFWEGDDGVTGWKNLQYLYGNTKIPGPIVESMNNQSMTLRLFNGSVLMCVASDTVDSQRGANPRGAVLSEFDYQNPKFYQDVLMPIFLRNKGWLIFNSTPNGESALFQLENSFRGHPDWFFSIHQALWEERDDYIGHLLGTDIKKEIEEYRLSGTPEWKIEQEYGASYGAAIEGSYYSESIKKATLSGRIGSYPHNPNKLVDTFWDLGRNDFCAIWFRQIDGGTVNWIDYHEERGLDMNRVAMMLAQKGYQYRTHYMPHDADNQTMHSKTLRDEFEEACIERSISSDIVVDPRIAKGGKIAAISLTRSRFFMYKFNLQTCATGIERLRRYHAKYDPKRDIFSQEPVHDESSHAADAIRIEATNHQALHMNVSESLHPRNNNNYNIKVDSYYDVFEETNGPKEQENNLFRLYNSGSSF